MRYINTLREGETIRNIYLCKGKRSAETRNGKPYDNLILQDKTGTLDGKVWDPNSGGIADYEEKDFIEVYGDIISYNNNLQMNAFAVVSDSGTLPEESSYFTSINRSFPAVCIRTSTERPEALDKGCFILAGIDEKSLLQAVETAVEMNKDNDLGIPVPDYVEENVSTKVVKLIQSYTGVVNKMVWRK